MWATITRLASDKMFSDKLNPHGLLGSVGLTRLAPAARRWCCGLRFSFSPTLSNPLKQQQRLHWLAGHDAESVEIVESRPDANHSVHCQAWNFEIPQAQCKEPLPQDYRTGSHLPLSVQLPSQLGAPYSFPPKDWTLKVGDKLLFFSNKMSHTNDFKWPLTPSWINHDQRKKSYQIYQHPLPQHLFDHHSEAISIWETLAHRKLLMSHSRKVPATLAGKSINSLCWGMGDPTFKE